MYARMKKWGNSTGVVIPAVALAKSGFEIDSEMELVAEAGRIILKRPEPSYALEELLAQTTDRSIALDDEDKAWLRDEPVGKEH